MDKMICKKDIAISSQNICFGYLLESPQAILTNIQNMFFDVLMQYSWIISH